MVFLQANIQIVKYPINTKKRISIANVDEVFFIFYFWTLWQIIYTLYSTLCATETIQILDTLAHELINLNTLCLIVVWQNHYLRQIPRLMFTCSLILVLETTSVTMMIWDSDTWEHHRHFPHTMVLKLVLTELTACDPDSTRNYHCGFAAAT